MDTVRVYRNLNKAKKDRTDHVWSIQSQSADRKWRVRGHSRSVVLADPVFRIQSGGADKVRATQVRQVCAYMQGTEVAAVPHDPRSLVRISFNPLNRSDFYRSDTGATVTGADALIFTSTGCFAVNPR
jgi:hypothetical protein